MNSGNKTDKFLHFPGPLQAGVAATATSRPFNIELEAGAHPKRALRLLAWQQPASANPKHAQLAWGTAASGVPSPG